MGKKKIIKAIEEEISPYDFDGKLSKVKARIIELIERYGDDAELDWERDFYYPYESNPSPMFLLKIERLETDEEFAKRIADEKAIKAAQEQRERAEFERLAKKFGRK